MKRNIILMGPPAAGKGTLAVELRQLLNIPHISTGDMFREAIANKTELGVIASSYINNGDLVPDTVTIGLVKERLSRSDCQNGFLLDGFPRTIAQAVALEDLTREINRPIEVIINLECDTNELVRRVSGRRVCPKCGASYNVNSMKPKVDGICDICGTNLIQRPDDNEEAFKVRLHHYNLSTSPLIEFYSAKGLVKNFDSLCGKEILLDEVSKYLSED